MGGFLSFIGHALGIVLLIVIIYFLFTHVRLVRVIIGIVLIVIGIILIVTLIGGAAGAQFVKQGIKMISDD